MWLTVALVTCVVCWAIGFLVTRSRWWADAMAGADSAIRVIALECAVVVFAPLVLPFGVVLLGKFLIDAYREQGILERSARTFRAYEFVEVNECHLDDSISDHFELLTPPLVQLGYDWIGDFRLKPEPIEVHDRFLLSHDGETLASVCALLDTGSVCLTSVLENGTCVDTCSSEDPDPQRVCAPADQLLVSYLPDASVADLERQHRKVLQERCSNEGTRVLRLRRDQFREVVTYDQRVLCRWRFRNGGMDHEPPAPDFSSLLAPPPITAPTDPHLAASLPR